MIDGVVRTDDVTNARLVLGTAQLGMPYGIANHLGKPDFSTAIEIIRMAWENGIREFDTAQAYGESERVLGNALSDLGISQQAKIITKMDPHVDLKDEKAVKLAAEKSLENLRVNRLYGLMLHRDECLCLSEERLEKIIDCLVHDGFVMQMGISVYTPDKGMQAVDSGMFDLIQVPANVLDRRFDQAGVFMRAAQKQVKIYIRSIFLQGLLLMSAAQIPPEMGFVRPLLASFEQLSGAIGRSRRQIALSYIKFRFPEAMILFGAETPQQVKENVDAWSETPSISWMACLEEAFDRVDESIVDPRLWPTPAIKD